MSLSKEKYLEIKLRVGDYVTSIPLCLFPEGSLVKTLLTTSINVKRNEKDKSYILSQEHIQRPETLFLFLRTGKLPNFYSSENLIDSLEYLGIFNFLTTDYPKEFLRVKLEEEWYRMYRYNPYFTEHFNRNRCIEVDDSLQRIILKESIKRSRARFYKYPEEQFEDRCSCCTISFENLCSTCMNTVVSLSKQYFLKDDVLEGYREIIDEKLKENDFPSNTYLFKEDMKRLEIEDVKLQSLIKIVTSVINKNVVLSECEYRLDSERIDKIYSSLSKTSETFNNICFQEMSSSSRGDSKLYFNHSYSSGLNTSQYRMNKLLGDKLSRSQNIKHRIAKMLERFVKFKQVWEKINFVEEFTNDFVIAGGIVLDTLSGYKSNDVDCFIIANSEESALEVITKWIKRMQLNSYNAYNKASHGASTTPFNVDTRCFEITRSSNAISVGKIQFILRAYRDVEEIIRGFDLDGSQFAFYQNKFWTTPRGKLSLMDRTLYVDFDRMSPSYEYRICKYMRNKFFNLYIPNFSREAVNLEITENGEDESPGLGQILRTCYSNYNPKVVSDYSIGKSTPFIDDYENDKNCEYSIFISDSLDNIMNIPEKMYKDYTLALSRKAEVKMTNPGAQVTGTFHRTILQDISKWYKTPSYEVPEVETA